MKGKSVRMDFDSNLGRDKTSGFQSVRPNPNAY